MESPDSVAMSGAEDQPFYELVRKNIHFRKKLVIFDKKNRKVSGMKGPDSWRSIDKEEFTTLYSKFRAFDRKDLEKLRKMILETGMWRRAEYEIRDESYITFNLFPEVRVLRVLFKGNEKINESDLKRQLMLASGDRYKVEGEKANVRAIRKYYRQRGYFKASVDVDVHFDGKSDSVDLVYLIREGCQVRFGNVSITYVNFSTRHKLNGLLRIVPSDPFDQYEMRSDLDNVRDVLINDGYLVTVIHEPELRFSKDGSRVDIRIEVNPGPRFEVVYVENAYGKAMKLGVSGFQKRSRLNRAINLKSHTSFRKEDLEILSRRVQAFYRDIGYYYASVKWSLKDKFDSSRMLESVYNRIKNFKFTLKAFKDELRDIGGYIVSVPEEIKNVFTGKKKKNLSILREITFEITPGERIFVGRINIYGNDFLSPRKVLSIIRAASGLREGTPFSRVKLREGIESLKGYYHSRGFLNFDVSDIDYVFKKRKKRRENSEIVIDKGNRLEGDVHIYLREGVRTIVEKVQITGNRVLSSDKLLDIVDIEKGDIFNSEKVETAASALKSYYMRRGYFYFKFKSASFTEINSDYSGASIVFDVLPGPVVNVGSIILKGNYRTKSRVIVRKIDLRGGGILSKVKMIDSEEYLLRLGLFSSVKIATNGDLYEKNGLHLQDVLIEMKEGDFKNVQLGVGYNTEEKVRAFVALRHANVGGAGRLARARLKMNRRIKFPKTGYEEEDVGFWEYEISVGYREPGIARRPLDIEIDSEISYLQKKNPSYNIYRWGTLVSFIKNALFSKHINTRVSWKLTSDRIFGSTIEEDNRILVLSSIFPELFLDFRDKPINPSKGFFTHLKYELGDSRFGSTFDYREITGRFIVFIPLLWGINYFPSLRAGYLNPLESGTIPVEKRYFLGGRSSLRGYGVDQMGESVEGNPVGGNAFWNFRNNLKIPVYGALHLVLFYDLGRLYYQYLPVSEIKHTVGSGFSYQSPIGAINFEIGYKLRREAPESLIKAHFSIGNF